MYLLKLLIFVAYFYGIRCKNNLKTLTESMGQEVIEIGAPGKGLPEGLEEEPTAEFSGEEHSTTTIAAATKKDIKRITTKPPVKTEQINQLSQEEDESRIEKEFSEIYKDTDYKSETSELLEVATMETTVSQEALRQRGNKGNNGNKDNKENKDNFQFQPDSTRKAAIDKFRTSVDEIHCDKKIMQLSANIMTAAKGFKMGMDFNVFGLTIFLLCF